MKETFVLREEDLSGLAFKVAEILLTARTPRAKVILLKGDLGAGKTTFARELAEVLGIDKNEVNSPTFVLKKEYNAQHPIFKKLIHVDAYRFNEKSEAKILGLDEDLKDESTLIAIEWPNKMPYIEPDLEIVFAVSDDTTRDIALLYEKK